MASNTSNAIGTQRQFTPRAPETYVKRLQSVDVPREVMYERDNRGEQLYNALMNLGEKLYAEDILQEQRQQAIADKIAPLWYGNFTKEARKELTAAQMVALADPEYGLQDNPFALAVLDRMRGEEYANDAYEEFEELRKTRPHPANIGDAVGNFDAFWRDKFENNEWNISNGVAFRDGWNLQTVSNTNKVAKNWRTDEEERLKLDNLTSSLNAIKDTLGGDERYTGEILESKLTDIVQKQMMKEPQNPKERVEYWGTTVEEMVKWAGTDALDFVRDIQLADGKTVGELIDVGSLYARALQSDVTHNADWIMEMESKLNSCNTVEELKGLRETASSDREIDYINSRFAQRSGEIQRRIEREQEYKRRLSMEQAKQADQRANVFGVTGYTLDQLTQDIGAGKERMPNGKNIPTTKTEFEKAGFTQEEVMQAVTNGYMRLMADNKVPQANDLLLRCMSNPFIGSVYSKYIENQWRTALVNAKNGGDTSIAQMLDGMYNNSPSLVQGITTDETRGAFLAYRAVRDSLYSSDPDPSGSALRALSEVNALKVANPTEYSTALSERMSGYKVGDTNVIFADGSELSYKELGVDIQGTINRVAEMLMMNQSYAMDAPTAYRVAGERCAGSYLNFHGHPVDLGRVGTVQGVSTSRSVGYIKQALEEYGRRVGVQDFNLISGVELMNGRNGTFSFRGVDTAGNIYIYEPINVRDVMSRADALASEESARWEQEQTRARNEHLESIKDRKPEKIPTKMEDFEILD